MIKYNFDEEIDRVKSNAIKWKPEAIKMMTGIDSDEEMLPMWIADMEFKSPKEIIDRMKERVEHGIFGYDIPFEEYYSALVFWYAIRYDWKINTDWVTITQGIVPAINFAVRALTNLGDKVIVQQPVYKPFMEIIKKTKREVVSNDLLLENGKYVMDYDDLEEKAQDPAVKLLILCSPHNPVGRVWKKEELRIVGEICNKYHVTVIIDEIHSDIVLGENTHVPYGTLGEEFKNNAIICTSPGKSFGLTGLKTSNIIIPNKKIKKQFDDMKDSLSIGGIDTFGIVATTAAYTKEGAEWLNQMNNYLEENVAFINQFFMDRIPKVKLIEPEGTFLGWVDLRELGLSNDELKNIFYYEAKVLVILGEWFGSGGEGFVRINYACSRMMLERALNRIEDAINKILEGRKCQV